MALAAGGVLLHKGGPQPTERVIYQSMKVLSNVVRKKQEIERKIPLLWK